MCRVIDMVMVDIQLVPERFDPYTYISITLLKINIVLCPLDGILMTSIGVIRPNLD